MTSRTHSSKHSPRRLRAETLENRRVLAAGVNLTDDGALNIQGDADDNRIWVAQTRERLRVSIDGRTADFPADAVETVNIGAGEGDDTVRVFRSVRKPTRIAGGDGNDRLAAGSGPTFINGGEGNDQIRGGVGRNILLGSAGRDRISGGRGPDLIIGGAGGDVLRGGGGDDWIFGDGVDQWNEELASLELTDLAREIAEVNFGNDRIAGGRGNDNVFGGNGRDRVSGGVGDDLVNGGAGNDAVSGDAGEDVVIGGEGEDLLRGGLGADEIRARDGEADLILADSSDELFIDVELDTVRMRDNSDDDDGDESGDAAGTLF
ncbi:MAG: calcium-binding protein [Planctomycetota bacterium]